MTGIKNEQDNIQQYGNSNKFSSSGSSSETKNRETAVKNPSCFNDDYAMEQNNDIASEEARSEKSGRLDS